MLEKQEACCLSIPAAVPLSVVLAQRLANFLLAAPSYLVDKRDSDVKILI